MGGWLLLVLGVLLLLMSAADLACREGASLQPLFLGVVLVGIGAVEVIRRQAGGAQPPTQLQDPAQDPIRQFVVDFG